VSKNKRKNRDLWQQRVQSLTGRIRRGRARNNANTILFGYLVKEMRKEDGNDEIIADLIERIDGMFRETERALTHDDLRVKPAEEVKRDMIKQEKPEVKVELPHKGGG
jgi:hypothetical protein